MRIFWIIVFAVTLVWSAVNPKEPITWALEVAPAIIGFLALAMALLGAIVALATLGRIHDKQLKRL